MENIKTTTKKCTETDNPLVSILLATYEPQMQWLEEQLHSLNNQTYLNLHLYVRDDCSPTVSYTDIQSCVARCITSFPFTIAQNNCNLGSTATFEQLTHDADGDYFAYCDQDDAWHANKIDTCIKHIIDQRCCLVCSDVRVIDGRGTVMANSIQDLRKRHIFHAGEHLTGYLAVRNFVLGCTMLIDASIAKRALPFPNIFIHDHWLAICASSEGAIGVAPLPLIDYRQHEKNQTGILFGIHCKRDYYDKKVLLQKAKLDCIIDYFFTQGHSDPQLEKALNWSNARCRYFSSPNLRDGIASISYRPFGLALSIFELILPFIPERFFSFIIKCTQKGLL